jgi:beta-galactosidase
MRNILIALFLPASEEGMLQFLKGKAAMQKIDFNSGWEYRHLGSQEPFKRIQLPFDAMFAEERNPEAEGSYNVSYFPGRDYEFRKIFRIQKHNPSEKVFFEFEGVYRKAEITLNGVKMPSLPYGYSGFNFEATPYLKTEEEDNVLTVLAFNADQPNSRWYSGAGINRPVWEYIGPENHVLIDGIRLRTLSLDPCFLGIKALTSGTGTGRIEIYDKKGLKTAEAVFSSDDPGETKIFIPAPELWSPASPTLYRCKVSFGQDEAETAFGIRSISWGSDGLKLNGERLLLKGACIHSDNGILGGVTYPEAEERKARILLANGYNAIRSAHNPCSRYLMEAADKLGLLVLDEYADCWYIHKTQYDYASELPAHFKADLEAMVSKDYSHPSVIMYSIGNEVSETAQKRGIALAEEMTGYLHTLDSTRPVTCGVNIFFNFLSSIGFGVYSDKKAKREAGKKPVKKKAVGSEFFNNLAGLTGAGFMKRGAALHGSDVKTREVFAKLDVAGYNYGIRRYRHDLRKYPSRLILGTETFCSDAAQFLKEAKDNPRLLGDFVWAGFDYLGECGVGAWETEDDAEDFSKGFGWIAAGSGRIDLNGVPNGEALYTKAVFEADSQPYLAVTPLNQAGRKHSPSAWKMTQALPSWSWSGYEGKKSQAEVYARGYAATLLLNGKKIGYKKLKDFRACFRIRYASGVLTALITDKDKKELGRVSLKSAGQGTKLCLRPESGEIRNGGLVYLDIIYTDEEGIYKPLERHTVSLDVKGGELLAFGHACPFNKDGYRSRNSKTYFGRALAILRLTSPQASIRAEDEAGNQAQIEIKV